MDLYTFPWSFSHKETANHREKKGPADRSRSVLLRPAVHLRLAGLLVAPHSPLRFSICFSLLREHSIDGTGWAPTRTLKVKCGPLPGANPSGRSLPGGQQCAHCPVHTAGRPPRSRCPQRLLALLGLCRPRSLSGLKGHQVLSALCHRRCSALLSLLVPLFPGLAQWSPLTQCWLAGSGRGQRRGRLGVLCLL